MNWTEEFDANGKRRDLVKRAKALAEAKGRNPSRLSKPHYGWPRLIFWGYRDELTGAEWTDEDEDKLTADLAALCEATSSELAYCMFNDRSKAKAVRQDMLKWAKSEFYKKAHSAPHVGRGGVRDE